MNFNQQNLQSFQCKGEQLYRFTYDFDDENILYLHTLKKDSEETLEDMKDVLHNYQSRSKENSYFYPKNDLFNIKHELEIPEQNYLNSQDTEIKTEDYLMLKENLRPENENFMGNNNFQREEINLSSCGKPLYDENGKKKFSFVVHKLGKNMRRKRGKYNMCEPNFKELCIEEARLTGNLKHVTKKFGVPLKKLKRWLQVGANRQKGGGRKVLDPNMEVALLNWYNAARARNEVITGRKMQNKAKEFSTAEKFLASKGWLEKFLKKYKIYVDKDKY